MMKKLFLILAACALGVAFSALAAGRGQSAATAPGDCATLAVPVNSDSNLAYDAETGELAIDYTDAAGNDQTTEIDVSAPACRANRGVARAIAHALDAQADVVAGECASFKGYLADGAPTTVKGVTVDPDGARQYVARYCGRP